MAEIHVEKKRGPGVWLWVLLLVVLLLGVVVYLWQSGYIGLESRNTTSTGTQVEQVVWMGGGAHGA